MSQDDVAAVRRAYARLAAGELEAAAAEVDPAFELRPPDIYPEGPRIYHGLDGFARWLEETREAWAEWDYDPWRYVDAPPHVLVLVRVAGEGRGSGVRLDREVAHVWSLRDGRPAAVDVHLDVDAGWAAVGLEPGATGDRAAVDSARRAWEAASTSSLREHAERWWDPEIVYHEDPRFPGAATHRGREAVLARWEEYLEVLESTGPPRVERAEARDDHVVLRVAFPTRAIGSGVAMEHVWGYRQWMRDGRIVELSAFHDPEAAG